MGKFILGGISSSQLSTLVLDQKELVYDVDNNQIFYGDGTATGGLPLAGLTAINVSGGTTSNNLTNIVFSNLNGVTFGLNGSTLTASVNAGGAGVSQLNGSNGTLSLAVASSLSASTNGSTISFGLASNITTALQSAGAYLTTARASNDAIGLNTAGTNITWTVNSSGISINNVGLAGTGTSATNASITLNSNGLAISVSPVPSIGTQVYDVASAASTGTVTRYAAEDHVHAGVVRFHAGSNTGNTLGNTVGKHGDWVIAATNGLTVSGSTGTNGVHTAWLSVGNYITTQTVQPVAFSASNGSAQFETLYFSNANGVTFSTDHIAGTDIIKASVNTDYAGTNTGATNASITVNTSGVSISVAAPVTTNGLISGAVVSAGGAFTTASNFSFGNANGVSWGINGSTITASVNAGGGGVTLSTFIPYYPASTGVQTLGAQGATSASAWFFPVSVNQQVRFNQIEQLMTASFVSSTVALSQTVTHDFGLYSNNAGTLSEISGSSYSFAITASSVSATLSYPSAYGTGGGYTYTTIAATATAQAQSLFGTAGNRIMSFGFGDSMSLSEGLYWIGIHQRQSSSSANGGMAFALAGNVMAAAQNAGPMGQSTANYTGTANTLFKLPWGVATSTGSAGYGGSVLPSAVNVTAMGMTATVMPMMTFISR